VDVTKAVSIPAYRDSAQPQMWGIDWWKTPTKSSIITTATDSAQNLFVVAGYPSVSFSSFEPIYGSLPPGVRLPLVTTLDQSLGVYYTVFTNSSNSALTLGSAPLLNLRLFQAFPLSYSGMLTSVEYISFDPSTKSIVGLALNSTNYLYALTISPSSGKCSSTQVTYVGFLTGITYNSMSRSIFFSFLDLRDYSYWIGEFSFSTGKTLVVPTKTLVANLVAFWNL